ncbi:hypothetical protein G7046_g6810 [Stylonectria norvegica]|nr:hypothetical protein G7046_g6810 [Stylonectria norvegica]
MDNESNPFSSSINMDLEPQLANSYGKRFSYYAAILLVLLAVWVLQSSLFRKQTSKLDIPFYKASKTKWIFDAESLIKDSYEKFQDRVYQIKATEGYQVLVPAKIVGELKALPEDVLSATEAVSDALQTKYTKFSPGHNGELFALLVRTKLTQNFARLMPQLRHELEYVLAAEFPACEEWTSVKWQPFSLRAVARISGRAFVGTSISRQEQWMDTSMNYAVHVFTACVKLQFLPVWTRPVGQFFVSELRQIQRDIRVAKEMLKPVIEQRLRDLESPKSENESDDFIQWLMEALPAEEKGDVQTQAELQLILAAASIHTTNNLLCECMSDLAANPDIQQELRAEAYQILEVDSGWARKESMAKLKKLDSFMREVQRLRGNITSFIRKVMKPISLSDGTQLPRGTKLLAPQAGFSVDERYFPEPEKFDALRFYRKRQESDEASNRWQFTSLNDTNINFGAGKHACPGRFFASNTIKMILAHILINYDIRLREGEKRPQAMSVVMTKAPSPNAELEFKRRSLVE